MKEYIYTIELHPGEENEKGYWVSVPALPGCFSQGETYEEAVTNAREAIECYIESLLKQGEPIPEEKQQPAFIAIQVAMPA